jgi:hypothetical protein
MRPHEQMAKSHGAGQYRDDEQGEGLALRRQAPREQEQAQPETRCAEHDQCAPAARGIEQGEQQLGQPFMRHPSGARHGVRERIVEGQRPMGDHPAPGGDMQIGIRVEQQCRRPEQRNDPADGADDHGPGDSRHRAIRLGGIVHVLQGSRGSAQAFGMS